MKTRILFVLLFLILFNQFSYFVPSGNSQINSQSSKSMPFIEVVVYVQDVDVTQKTANLKFTAFIFNVPQNKSAIEIYLASSAGQSSIYCNNSGSEKDGFWNYSGYSEETLWRIYGDGESFPFDSYFLNLDVMDVRSVALDLDPLEDIPLSLDKTVHRGFLSGSKGTVLDDVWSLNDKGLLPIVQLASNEITFELQRSWRNISMLSMQFILPAILCYLLLGFSSMLSPKRLSERLRIYLSIFFFVPTFLFVIQNFLPYRSSLSFPEFLLYNLILSNTVFAIFSIIGHEKYHLLKYNLSSDELENSFLRRKYDFFATAFSIAIYIIIILLTGTYSTLFSGIILLNVIVLSYCIPIFVALPTRRKKYLILFFGIPNILMIIVGLISWLITGQFF